MNTPIISVKDVRKVFHPVGAFSDLLRLKFHPASPVIALDKVSFCIRKRSCTGILGTNGAGKTTLFKTIATLILADSGKILIDGHLEAGIHDEAIKMKIGLVYAQEKSFYWRLTGRQNLEFFSNLYGLNRRQTDKRLGELFEFFRVDYGQRRFNTYSAGMKQTLGLVRSLIHDPEILLLDEPTKSLDYATAKNLRRFIKDLVMNHKKTALLATHNMEEAEELCDEFILINKGRIRAQGNINDLRRLSGIPNGTLGETYLKLCT